MHGLVHEMTSDAWQSSTKIVFQNQTPRFSWRILRRKGGSGSQNRITRSSSRRRVWSERPQRWHRSALVWEPWNQLLSLRSVFLYPFQTQGHHQTWPIGIFPGLCIPINFLNTINKPHDIQSDKDLNACMCPVNDWRYVFMKGCIHVFELQQTFVGRCIIPHKTLFLSNKGRRSSCGALMSFANSRSIRPNFFSNRRTTRLPVQPSTSGWGPASPVRHHQTGSRTGFCLPRGVGLDRLFPYNPSEICPSPND